MSQRFTLTVNGKSHTINADPDMPLLYALRNDIGLTILISAAGSRNAVLVPFTWMDNRPAPVSQRCRRWGTQKSRLLPVSAPLKNHIRCKPRISKSRCRNVDIA